MEVNPDYGEDYVEKTAGEGINVRITIPKMLPESMFPLVFSLESDVLSITPNTAKYPEDNLPVASGNSICTGKESSKSFHYVRTLSYTEYQTLDETLDGIQFTCHFKTNKAESASNIFVDNQYFNKGNDSFYNYTMYNFRNLDFSNNSAGANTNVNFTFYLDDADSYPSSGRTVEVKLDGLIPQDGAGLNTEDFDAGIYSYTIQGGSRYATLALKTISTAAGFDNTYSVTLNAYDAATAIYHEASHGNVAQRITIDPDSYTWTSSNNSVATVDANGKVTAVALGTANITASQNGMSATCVITVAGISLNKTSTKILIGGTEQLTATVYPSASYTWTSSNPAVATVSSTGLVTAVAKGTTTITVTTEDGGYTASCTVRVGVRKTVTTSAINTNSGTFNINNGEGSLTAQGLKIDVGIAYNSTANYLEMGLRYNRRDYNGTLSISSSETLDDFSITGVNFTYTEYNYAQGAVTPSTGTYTRPANNATTASWSGSATSSLTFTMAPRTQGNTRYWNRLRSIVVTYTYTEY